MNKIDTNGIQVLIADDDMFFRVMLRQFLENLGYEVLEAINGQQAVDIFEQHHPRIVLMDASMPILDGIEACAIIRERDKHEYSPVLMVTASDEKDLIDRSFAAGAADYIAKPIHWPLLENRMQYMLKASSAAHVLQENEHRFRRLFEKSPLGYQLLDKDGCILEVNPAWQQLLGFDETEVLGHHFIDFMTEDSQADFADSFTSFKDYDIVQNADYTLQCKNGAEIIVNISGRVEEHIETATMRTHAILHDVTLERKQAAELTYLATTDSLTNINNRRHFFELSEHTKKHCTRYQHNLCAMMLDIDHFKSVNDTFGHAAGDDILKATASTIADLLRDVDIFGRLGGEEFAIILPETELDKAQEVAERIRHKIEEMVTSCGHGDLQITMSLGVAQLQDDEKIELLLQRCDEALYKAKASGRNRVVISDGSPTT